MGGISPSANRTDAQVRFGGLASLRFRAALLSAILSNERQGGGAGGALCSGLCTSRRTAMFLALILGGGAFALITWLIFKFSVYALPFFVGITAAKLAHDSGAGLIGLGQFAFGAAKSVTGRIAVGAVFAAPAAVGGYFSTYGIAQLCIPTEGWRQVFPVIGGGGIAAVAFGRLMALAPSRDGVAGTARRRACPRRPESRGTTARFWVGRCRERRAASWQDPSSAALACVWTVQRSGPAKQRGRGSVIVTNLSSQRVVVWVSEARFSPRRHCWP